MAHALERMARVVTEDNLILAVPDTEGDEELRGWAHTTGIQTVVGPEEDVLSRFLLALEGRSEPWTIRLCADSPFVDPEVVQWLLRTAQEQELHHVTIDPWSLPPGFETEIVRTDALRQAAAEASTRDDREHVTRFIRQRPDRFRVRELAWREGRHRFDWSVLCDHPEDLVRLERIHEALEPHNPCFGGREALEHIGESWEAWMDLERSSS